MKKYASMVLVLIGLILPAWSQPSADQIQSVVDNPAQLAGLLEGKSAEDAAEIVKLVLLEINGSDLSADLKTQRIVEIVRQFLAAAGAENAGVYASALGAAIGNSVELRSNPAIVSLVQDSIAGSNTDSGAELAEAFAAAYTAAAGASAPGGDASGEQGQTFFGDTGGGDGGEEEQEDEPPVAPTYPNQ